MTRRLLEVRNTFQALDFTGRWSERRELKAAASQRSPMMLGLFGPGGVGKTALALALANDLAAHYPDAQLLLEPRQMGQPQPATAIMRQVIWAFDPTAKLLEDAASLLALYASTLRGRRALLIVDNAANHEQLAPLGPPAGCLLLVTSPERIELPGLYGLTVAPLADETAQELLLKMAPRIGKRAAELAELCSGLPFSLRLAGSALAARQDLDPAGYADRLQEKQWDQPELDEAQASLALSYDLLTGEQQRLWRELAVFPADFTRLAAGAVWDLDDEATSRSLDDLARYGLVACDDRSKRYRLHDLARLAASKRLEPLESEEVQGRHAAQYLKVLEAAGTLYRRGGDSRARGLKLFDLEQKNIATGQAWAARRAAEDPMAARLARDYPFTGALVLEGRQGPPERLAWLEAAEKAARQLGDRESEGVALSKLGSVYRRRTEPRWAIDYYERQLRIARELGDRTSEGAALGNLGLAYAELGNARRALDYYLQHLEIARELGDRTAEARTSWNLGLIYEEQGQLARAIEAMEVCVAFERAVGHPDAEQDAATVHDLRARLAGGGAE